MSNTIKIIFLTILIILLFFSALFSAAETAYTSVSLIKMRAFNKKGRKWPKLVNKHYKSFSWTLSTILLSNNIVNVGISSISTYLFNDLFNAGVFTTIISIVIVTPILVICGEIFPKILARKYSIGYLKKVVYLIHFLNYLFFPITFPLSKITLGSKVTNTEKDLQNALAIACSEGVLETNEATLAQKALELDSKKVRSVMTLKKDIIWISNTSTISSVKKLFAKSGFSRILVRDKKNYLGYLILKDIIFADNGEKINNYIVSTTYISQAIIVSNALEKMRIDNCHIALVTTSANSKSVVGIITIEDIVEELVGEIYDEHDQIEKVREIAHSKYIVNGSTFMHEVEKEIAFGFDDSKNMTIKQWIQSRINRKIKTSLKYEYKNKIIFKIIKNNNKSETIIQIIKKNK